MKIFIKKNLKVFVAVAITAILFTSIGVCAAKGFFAKDISFTSSNTNFKATNVEEALNELYSISSAPLSLALSDLKEGNVTIHDNNYATMYAALISYTSLPNASSVIDTRTKLVSTTCGNYEEILYKFSSSTSYGIRIYKLTDCGEIVTVITGNTGDAGQIILFR